MLTKQQNKLIRDAINEMRNSPSVHTTWQMLGNNWEAKIERKATKFDVYIMDENGRIRETQIFRLYGPYNSIFVPGTTSLLHRHYENPASGWWDIENAIVIQPGAMDDIRWNRMISQVSF
jgi:hypothetical protein